MLSPPIFSKKSGFYPDNFFLGISTKEEADIYYTIDGTNPLNSESAKKYKEPILIYNRTEEPNLYSDYGEIVNSSISYINRL